MSYNLPGLQERGRLSSSRVFKMEAWCLVMGKTLEAEVFLTRFYPCRSHFKVLCASLHQPILRGAGLASLLLCTEQ